MRGPTGGAGAAPGLAGHDLEHAGVTAGEDAGAIVRPIGDRAHCPHGRVDGAHRQGYRVS